MPKHFLLTKNEKFELKPGTQFLGRENNNGNSICINEMTISEKHLLISNFDKHVEIMDLNSKNGTVLNDILLTPYSSVRLKKGDRIKTGELFFEYDVDFKDVLFDKGRRKVTTGPLKMHTPEQNNVTVFAKYDPKNFTTETLDDVDNLDVLHQNSRRLAFLYTFGQSIGNIFELRELFNYLLKEMFEVYPIADRAIVFLNNGGIMSPQIFWKNGIEQKIEDASYSSTIVSMATIEKHGFIASDLGSGVDTSNSIVLLNLRCTMISPFIIEDELFGLLQLDSVKSINAFTEDDLKILSAVCNQIAVKIKNKQLINKINKQAKNLKFANAKLEEYSRTLQQKVDERTQELKVKNEELNLTLRQLKEMQNQMIQQEKMASLGSLTAGIAHEIKNPLNFVNNFAQLTVELSDELREIIENQKDKIAEDGFDEISEILDDIEQNARKINEHGKRADSIIHGMLLHSRGKTGEKQPTDINALLDEYVSLAYHGLRAKDNSFNVSIEKELDPSLPKINVVPQDISRVFLNIVNNGCYAANEKRRSLGESFSPVLSVKTTNLGHKIEVRIKDNGKGIPKELKEKIFNPFFTTKPTGEGTGLGLSLSYDIVVQEHQGEITVESEENSFTEFKITLPVL